MLALDERSARGKMTRSGRSSRSTPRPNVRDLESKSQVHVVFGVEPDVLPRHLGPVGNYVIDAFLVTTRLFDLDLPHVCVVMVRRNAVSNHSCRNRRLVLVVALETTPLFATLQPLPVSKWNSSKSGIQLDVPLASASVAVDFVFAH